MNSIHTIIVNLEAKKNNVDKFKALLIEAAKKTLALDICLEFRCSQYSENSCTFIIYESWASKSQFMDHLQKPGMKEKSIEMNELLTKPFHVNVLLGL